MNEDVNDLNVMDYDNNDNNWNRLRYVNEYRFILTGTETNERGVFLNWKFYR